MEHPDASPPLAAALEHTLLAATATRAQIERHCAEARTAGLFGVCLNPVHVERAVGVLAGTGLKVVTVVGFPLGASHRESKAFEAELAVKQGAAEIDMVIQIGALKSGDRFVVRDDIAAVVRAAGESKVKVILETSELTEGEKRLGCALAEEAGAAFVKTSTGFASAGASVADVRLLRECVGTRLGVKASGGIRSAAFAQELMLAGANRIGTSVGVQLAAEVATRGA